MFFLVVLMLGTSENTSSVLDQIKDCNHNDEAGGNEGQHKAEELHERERVIKAARGQILDAKGRILADNKTVCTISVIHSQIKDPQKVIEVLSKELEIDTDTVRKKVEKIC